MTVSTNPLKTGFGGAAVFVNVKDLPYGAKGDDTTDDTTAIQAAIDAAIAAGGGTVYFPPGNYAVLGQLYIKGDHVVLRGASTRGSCIRAKHTLGPAITVEHASSPGTSYINSLGLQEISVRARVETTTGCCVLLNKVQQVYVDAVSLEDHFGGIEIRGGLQHYYTNLSILSARSTAPVSWTGAKVGSFFLKVGESSDGQTPTELFISNFNFRRNEALNYIEHGIVINSVDGLWLSNGHVMGVSSDDMRVEPVAGDEQITGIRISNVWADNNCQVALRVVGNTTAAFGEIELNGFRILTPGNIGVFVEDTATAFEGIRWVGGALRKSESHGMLIRAGKRHLISAVDFGACNTDAAANTAAITVDGGADKVQAIACTFDQTALGVTAASMIGVRVNAGASTEVQANGCSFDLAADDISDASTSDANNYSGNVTTKAATATAVAGSSLTIAEIGDQFYVTAGLNFNNMSGRWNGRKVTLVFAGASTVTHGAGGIRLAGAANFVAKAGDTITLLYSPDLADWIEVARMVS
jgi:hypothetical protein